MSVDVCICIYYNTNNSTSMYIHFSVLDFGGCSGENVCNNHGVCGDFTHYHTCTCVGDHTGPNCEFKISE